MGKLEFKPVIVPTAQGNVPGVQANTTAKLLSINEELVTSKGPNGSKFVRVSVLLDTGENGLKQKGAIMWEKNFMKGVQVGETYLATVTVSKGNPLASINVSSLPAGGTATPDEFGIDMEDFDFADVVETEMATAK